MNKEKKSLYVSTHDYTTLTKVGVSKNIPQRLIGMKNSAGAELSVYYESPLLDNWKEIENNVLNYFSEFKTGGEWLNKTPKEVINYIETIEHLFNSVEYTYLEDSIEKELEQIGEVSNPFKITSYNSEKDRVLTEVHKGIYMDDRGKFYVSYLIGKNKRTIWFNVLETAIKFIHKIGFRLIELDLKNKEFIINPKYRTENE